MNIAAYRRSMAAGIVFVILFVAGAITSLFNAPELKSSDTAQTAAAKYHDVLSSSGHRAGLVIGAYLLILAGIAFIWFVNGLRSRLEAAEPTDAIAPRVLSGLAVFGAGALAAGGMASAVVAGAVSADSEPVPASGDAMRIVMDMAFPFVFVVFGLVSAALILTLVVTALRNDTFPRWVVHTGWLGALGSVLGIMFTPMVLPMLWYLAVGIAGLAATAAPTRVEQSRGVPASAAT